MEIYMHVHVHNDTSGTWLIHYVYTVIGKNKESIHIIMNVLSVKHNYTKIRQNCRND